ncbi:MAG: NAD(P)H-hydrate dehydratase [Pyrinomonadaceae bacterium]
MRQILSTGQMREVDRLTVEIYKTPSLLLMESAANATLQTITSCFKGGLENRKALVLCGKGNNGGDGAALARGLARSGIHTDVVLFGKLNETDGDVQANFTTISQLASFHAGSAISPAPVTFHECEGVSQWERMARPRGSYDLIVDALFGTGLTRPLDGVYLKVVEHLAMLRTARERADDTKPLILSIDIPSGLNADTPEPIGAAVKADVTVTFTAPKPANVLPPACEFNGRLVVSDIGSPATLIDSLNPWLFLTEEDDVKRWLVSTRYTFNSYKNTHGHVLIAAGSKGYTGAAALCGSAAIRAGAGLVTVATPASAQDAVAASVLPEVITIPLAETDRGVISDEATENFLRISQKASVVAIGPGLTSDDERTRKFVRAIAERRTRPMVIDADGLNCLAPWPSTLKGSDALPLILTPHPGEMLRLIGTTDASIMKDRAAVAREFATANRIILLLKGSRSLVAAPDGRVFVNPTGNPGLGTAGAGDTLTGLIAAFLGQAVATLKDETDALAATIAALYVGGVAGDLAANKFGMRTLIASDLREHFSAAICALDPMGEFPDDRSS